MIYKKGNQAKLLDVLITQITQEIYIKRTSVIIRIIIAKNIHFSFLIVFTWLFHGLVRVWDTFNVDDLFYKMQSLETFTKFDSQS